MRKHSLSSLIFVCAVVAALWGCRWLTPGPTGPSGTMGSGSPASPITTSGPQEDRTPPVVADVTAPGTIFMGGVCSPTMLSVSARVTDDKGVASVAVLYRYPGHTDFLQVPMAPFGQDAYGVQIPAGDEGARFSDGQQPVRLEFQILATDVAGNTTRYPASPVPVSILPCIPQDALPPSGGNENAPGAPPAPPPASPQPPQNGGANTPDGGNSGVQGGTENGNNDGSSGGMVELPPEYQVPPPIITFDPNQIDLGDDDNGAGSPGGAGTAQVRFCNTSQSPIVSLLFRYADAQGPKEEEVIQDLSQVIGTGMCLTVSDFQPGVQYSYVAAAGFWDASGKTITRYLAVGSLVLQSNETREVTISEPPAPQVLTEFGTVSSYCGAGWVGLDMYIMQLNFDSQQPTYTLLVDGQELYSGTYQEVRRSPSLLVLQFDRGFEGTYKYAYGEISLTDIPMPDGRTMLFVSLTKLGCR